MAPRDNHHISTRRTGGYPPVKLGRKYEDGSYRLPGGRVYDPDTKKVRKRLP